MSQLLKAKWKEIIIKEAMEKDYIQQNNYMKYN